MALQLVEKQVIFDGVKVRLELHHLEPEEGGKRHRREICVHPGAVVILPILDDQTVLLIRVRRYAVGRSLLELPAGTLEKGELPINCAGRELVEETGYLANRMQPLGAFFTSPGILSEQMHAFVATDLEEQGQQLEEGEEIEVVPTPIDEALDMVRSGAIEDGKTIAALLMYEVFRRRPAAGDDSPIVPETEGR